MTFPGYGEDRAIVCAFVGCSPFSQRYLSVYRDTPGTRVKVCVDIVPERAQLAADLVNAGAHGQGTMASTEFEAALADDVDVVVINTPNYLHREQAVAALQRGKHVLLQKPLAANMTDALAIQAAAQEASGFAGVYMSYFDHPLIHDLRSMAQMRWFGSITQIHARLMHPGGMTWSEEAAIGSPSWRGSIEQTGGGAFIQLAVHYLRIANWILDDSVARIFGFASNLNCPGLEGEDTAVAVIEFTGGCLATLNVSWCAQGEELSVHGTRGNLTYLDNQYVHMQSAHDFQGQLLRYTAGDAQLLECGPVPMGDAHQPFNQHRKFLEDVRAGRRPFFSIEAGVQDVAVTAAFYEAVRSGRAVSLRPAARGENHHTPLVDGEGASRLG